MSYNQKIFLSWKRTPLIFDFWGKFYSPQKKESRKKNELIGKTLSYGKIKRKAKVLRNINEKEFFPGWTPLIINSGGVVLEVGGMLQHGALVSRKFNKPSDVNKSYLFQLISEKYNLFNNLKIFGFKVVLLKKISLGVVFLLKKHKQMKMIYCLW